MHTPDWVQDAIFYQIFPDRFAKSKRNPASSMQFEPWDSAPTYHGFKGGDLYGVAEKLDYLHNLGINAIYLNPIFSSASNHRYHTYDFYNVDPLLGGNDALKVLLAEAHQRGMKVVLDGVFNHASRGIWQFHHVLESGAGSPYKDWFHFNEDHLLGKKHWGAYPTKEEEKAIQRDGTLKAIGYQGWWNLPALPKFNTKTPAVRAFLFDIAEHWIKFGIDGWRLDVPGEIDDDSFWQEFRRRVRALNGDAYIVGEIWHESQRWLQGDQFDAVMNYLVTAASLSFFGARTLDLKVAHEAGGIKERVHAMDALAFANEVDRIQNLYRPEVTRSQLNLLDSHDMPRFLSCVGGDKSALKLAWLFILAIPGAPCIYYGDEIGVDGRHDPECRKSFPWDEAKWDRDLLDYLKTAISLRKTHPSLRRGTFSRLWSADGVYAFGRAHAGESLVVAFNASESPRPLEVSYEAKRKPKALFGQPSDIESKGGKVKFTIPARSGVVLG
ncbi:MAG: glycoside hydrolase family 13 protein [Chloroflexi bacterium]|nr:glycoside hydrolase family 13 protein [Chloroflexota bacterium]